MNRFKIMNFYWIYYLYLLFYQIPVLIAITRIKINYFAFFPNNCKLRNILRFKFYTLFRIIKFKTTGDSIKSR